MDYKNRSERKIGGLKSMLILSLISQALLRGTVMRYKRERHRRFEEKLHEDGVCSQLALYLDNQFCDATYYDSPFLGLWFFYSDDYIIIKNMFLRKSRELFAIELFHEDTGKPTHWNSPNRTNILKLYIERGLLERGITFPDAKGDLLCEVRFHDVKDPAIKKFAEDLRERMEDIYSQMMQESDDPDAWQ